MNKKHWQNVYHENVNVNLMVENKLKMKSRIRINPVMGARKQ